MFAAIITTNTANGFIGTITGAINFPCAIFADADRLFLHTYRKNHTFISPGTGTPG